ncbi:MAG: acetyl-CoA carboxylase carboxyltransferase subunit beta [Clostridia bacterium]|nr:acetyl-CoA carboxylase, carboxyltransferase subunit beta [Lachnospiraceae bacterium]NCC01448.1 acetyl-CoA carboxylase carboxyltransferase subunit beta [Clostridia bacterium]NCD02112.1 acetyl-CoA carboxylase carboxyltransferase subunit beta [Clostridia bacterium]
MPKLNSMFKKTTYITLSNRRQSVRQDSLVSEGELDQPNIPEGLWTKCEKCGAILYKEELEKNLYVCGSCGNHQRVSAQKRIEMIADEGSFVEMDSVLPDRNPLDFPEYDKKIKAMREATGLNEGVIYGKCTINGEETILAVMDSKFMMGSMGTAVGEKVTRAIEKATEVGLPVIIFTCSGGARMQEGILSLMQMAKTSAAVEVHGRAGLPYFTVITDPTTGGVTASFAMLGDVILTEPGTLIGFAGQRVIEQTIGQKLPEGFQRADFMLEHGFIDQIVERKDLKERLYQLIRAHKPLKQEVEE